MSIVNSNNEQPRRRGGCLRSCLIALAIYLGLSALVGVLFGDMFTQPTVKLEDNSVYKLDLAGNLVEQGAQTNPFMEMMNGMPGYNRAATVGLDQILANIELAENNDKVKGIYLYDGKLAMSPASAKAIRDRLQLFKQRSGKWIIAYSDGYNATNYYVATVADRMYLNPIGHLGWHGLAAEKMYMTRLLEKLG